MEMANTQVLNPHFLVVEAVVPWEGWTISSLARKWALSARYDL
jgi:hypothetical protein